VIPSRSIAHTTLTLLRASAIKPASTVRAGGAPNSTKRGTRLRRNCRSSGVGLWQ
jgi:hypothetical protein